MKKAKIFGIIGAVLVIGAVVGTVLMGKYVADRILYQNKDNDTKSNSIKQLDKWGYDINKFMDEHEGYEISVEAKDGNKVPATVFENDSNKWVILVHGAGGDRVSTYPLAEQYLEDDFSVIAIDQRGSGDNQDPWVTFGINEKMDVAAMVKYARTELDASEVIVHGQSMGAQTTALYASSVKAGAVDAADAVICDSPVPGMELQLRLVFGDGFEGAHSFSTNFFIATSGKYMDKVYDVDMDDGDTIKMVATDEIPTMIIVSEKDEVCLPELVEQVYDNIGTDKKEIAYVNSAHIEGIIDDPDGYMESVEGFLNTYGL